MNLIIADVVEPYFTQVNMNGTENIYDSETARMTTIILQCYVTGMPPPVVSWWKVSNHKKKKKEIYHYILIIYFQLFVTMKFLIDRTIRL